MTTNFFKKALSLLVLGSVLLVPAAAEAKRKRNHRDKRSRGSNTYLGLTSNNNLSNARQANGNENINSTNVGSLEVEWMFDVNSVVNDPEGVLASRIVGALSTPQVDKDTVYFVVGTFQSDQIAPDQELDSRIIALDRKTGQLKWERKYTDVSTEAQKMIGAKFGPSEYDPESVANFERSPEFGGSFAPITVFGDYVITGDGNGTNEVFTNEYFASVPQGPTKDPVTGLSPILGASWGITNETRVVLRTTIMVLNKHTGKLVAVDRYADSGEEEAQGYCQVEAALRMPVVYRDPCTNDIMIAAGASIPPTFTQWTLRAPAAMGPDQPTAATQIQIGEENGNRATSKGGRITLFRLKECKGKKGKKRVELKEKWRFYPTPRALFAGDANPYPADERISFQGDVFETDPQAEKYNYAFAGVWAMRPLVDLDNRRLVFPTGNGNQMPAEDINAAFRAQGTLDPVTGAQGDPDRPYFDLYSDFNAVQTSPEGIAQVQRDYRQTYKDKISGIRSLQGTRFNEYFGNSIVSLDLDTGEVAWGFRAVIEAWISSTFQAQEAAQQVPAGTPIPVNDFNKWQYLNEGGDLDFGIGPIRVKNCEKNIDIYVALQKSGVAYGLDPKTGAELWNTRGAFNNLFGSFIFAATTDNEFVYAVVGHQFGGATSQSGPFEAISTLGHRTTLDTANEGTVPEVLLADGFSLENRNWTTNRFIDVWDDLGGGAGKTYFDTNITIPQAQSYIVKLEAQTGAIVAIAQINPRPNQFPFSQSVQIAIVNDVLLVGAKSSSKFRAFDSTTFEPLWEYDAFEDVKDIPDYPTPYIFLSSSPVAAGKNLYAGAGDFFIGRSPGKWFYSWKVKDKPAKCKQDQKALCKKECKKRK